MANVRIESEAFTDRRIHRLGEIAGYNEFEALGRLAHLWHTCTQRQVYIVEEFWVKSCLGEKGPEAIVGAGLAEKMGDGYRIKGTEGRIEWLKNLRANSRAGGEANKIRLASLLAPDSKARSSQTGPKSEPDGSQKDSQKASQIGAKAEPKQSPSSSSISSLPSEEKAASPPASAAEQVKPRKTKARKPRTVPDTPHHNAIGIFKAQWEAKYCVKFHFAGEKKDDGGKNGVAVREMLDLVDGDLDRFAAIVSLYLADDQKFLFDEKHPIGLLRTGFNKYSAAANGHASTSTFNPVPKDNGTLAPPRARKVVS